jgi:hypothetical protein
MTTKTDLVARALVEAEDPHAQVLVPVAELLHLAWAATLGITLTVQGHPFSDDVGRTIEQLALKLRARGFTALPQALTLTADELAAHLNPASCKGLQK